MNDNFVSVKVDREERPDLDAVYMDAVVALSGSGGWPMTVFLTPAGEPFFGGTYFPPEPRHGLPSFKQVLLGVAEAWRDQRDAVRELGPQPDRPRPPVGAPASRRASRSTRRCWTTRSRTCARASTRGSVASAARRSSRPPPCSSSCCDAASAR